jgi:hypothetical protein
MNEQAILTFLTGSGATLGTFIWFLYMQRKENRDRLVQLNQSIYSEIDRLQVKLSLLEQQRDHYREEFYKVREEQIKNNKEG